MPIAASISRILVATQVFEQVIVGFGSMAPEEHAANVVNGGDGYARLAQERV
jgi:hypothetical protein